MLNIIYFGSPAFSAEILNSLLENPEMRVVGVVTQPDKPVGRKQVMTPSSVARLASEHDIPTYKPTKLDDAHLAHIRLLKADIFLVVSYGAYIPSNWLSAPSIGTYNIHFSLLPKYRGSLCIQEAIKNQDHETGVTLMKMDEELDHGPILKQEKVKIDPNDNVADLTKKLTTAAIFLLRSNIRNLRSVPSIPQDENLATKTPSLKTLTRQNAFIYWEQISKFDLKTNALINSLNPDPGAWTIYHDQEIKILKTKVNGNQYEILEVQIPSKNPISWKQFLSGHGAVQRR